MTRVDRPDDFYVGYLPTPPAHKRFARVITVVAVAAAAFGGFMIARSMDDPGPGAWDTSAVIEVAGVLRLEPTPFIQTEDGPVLLVEQGKFGPRDLTSFGDGQPITAQGALLSRHEIRMLELAAGDDAVTERVGQARAKPLEDQPAARVTASGEIVDSKCYLGAMKPGSGKTHAACARLCVRGGIPAVLVTDTFWAVIAPETGRDTIAEELITRIGEPVTVEGSLTSTAGLPVLRSARLRSSPD